jgi:hypothetical protein
MPAPGTPLTAPPGYVGYTPTPLGNFPLKRVGALSKAAMILVAVAGLCSLLTYLIGLPLVDDAEAFLRGETSSDDFARTMAPYGVVVLVQGVATIAAVVLVMIWMYRLAANLRAMHRGTRWGPGWAIGGWFLPPLLYIIPFLMFREMWKASDPDIPIGGDWTSRPVSWVVTAWFVVYGPISVVVQAVSASSGFSLGGSERDLAQQVVDAQDTAALAGVAGVVAAVLFVVMAAQLTSRHKRLIGEE